REFLVRSVDSRDGINEIDEFEIPLLHSVPATILDYLPKNALILVDDLANIQSFGEEIEEQAIKNRSDSIHEGVLSRDFPIPYISWSEILETVQIRRWAEMGKPFTESVDPLGERFVPGRRFAGQLKSFIEHLDACCTAGESSY